MTITEDAIRDVDAAYAAGKFPISRVEHYVREYLRAPAQTAALLSALVPVAQGGDQVYELAYGRGPARAAAELADGTDEVYRAMYPGAA